MSKAKCLTELDAYCSRVDDEISKTEERSYLFPDIVCAIGTIGVLLLLVFFIGFSVHFFFENPEYFFVLLGAVGFFSLLRCMKSGIDVCEIYHFKKNH